MQSSSTIIHPDFGDVILNHPYDVRAFNKEQNHFYDYPNYKIVFINDINGCYIYKITTNRRIGRCRERAFLSNHLGSKGHKFQNVMLASAFPHINPIDYVLKTCEPTDKYKSPTIDHVDEEFLNNHITNLTWLSWSENARRGQQKAVRITNALGGRNGMYVTMFNKNEPEIPLQTFKSRECAAKYIMENIPTGCSPSLKGVATNISAVCNGRRPSAYGYIFKNVPEIVIPGEIWVDYYLDPEYKVSDHGRIRTKHQAIMCQYSSRIEGVKYRRVHMGKEHPYVHRVVFFSFNRDIDQNTFNWDVCHDDTIPTENSCHRNWMKDLTGGTRRNNMLSWHASRKK